MWRQTSAIARNFWGEREFIEAGSARIHDRYHHMIEDFPAYVRQLLADQGQRRGRRGYGKEALALALERAWQAGLRRVLHVCRDSNVASRRIIEAGGGELEGIFRLRERDEPPRRYWIAFQRA